LTSVAQIMRFLTPSGRGRNELLGIEFGEDYVSFAHIRRVSNQQPQLLHCEQLLFEAGSNPVELLRARLLKLGLLTVPCSFVLTAGAYQLVLGEAPKVPAEELAEALRWRLKDVVQYPITEAVVDAFLLPEDSARGTNRMAYAVVCESKNIQLLADHAKLAGLSLKAIDIPELALRNLAEACCDTERGIALVKLVQGGGSLQIFRGGALYLSRQFSLPYNGGLLDDLPADALILELQRSLDYFERQMRQVPPTHVYLCGENVTPDKLTGAISNALAVSINVLDLASGLQIAEGVAEHSLSLCLAAVGVALRQDQLGSS